MKVLEAWQVVANHRLTLFLRQERQNRQAALPHAQRHAPTDIAGKRTDRIGPLAAVQADRIKAAAREQEQRIAEGSTQAQHARPYQVAQVAGLARVGCQREKLQAQAIAFAACVLLDHAFVHQAAQQAVGGGLGQADLLRELGHPFAAFRHLAQGAQQREQPRHAARTDFFTGFIPLSGIHKAKPRHKF